MGEDGAMISLSGSSYMWAAVETRHVLLKAWILLDESLLLHYTTFVLKSFMIFIHFPEECAGQ